jgi:hypothetical protein
MLRIYSQKINADKKLAAATNMQVTSRRDDDSWRA